MKIANRIIEGLLIFQKYHDTEFFIGADHDIIYAYATKEPIPFDDIKKLVELGWFQQDVECGDGDDFEPKYYDPEEGWGFYP